MPKSEYPRGPTPNELLDIWMLAAASMYGDPDRNKTEYQELHFTLQEARDSGRFIVSYGSSDTPGYCGPMAVR